MSLDTILGWLVIVAPFALSSVFILIPAKSDNPKVHMKWRYGLLVFGLLFSGAAWWQQSRAASSAVASTDEAINRTADRVSKADKVIMDAQNAKIDQLQKTLEAQSLAVKGIGSSPFVTGTKPVRVEVTNPSASSGKTAINPSRILSAEVLGQALLKTNVPCQAAIWSDGTNGPTNLATQLGIGLQMGGWKNVGGGLKAGDPGWYPDDLTVEISTNKASDDDRSRDAANNLIKALASQGIVARLRFTTQTFPANFMRVKVAGQ